jgi:Cu/Ag efflux protein CusF
MKKVALVLTGLIFALSLTGLAFAQAKPAEPAKAAEPAKPTAAKPEAKAEPAKPAEAKKEAPKSVAFRAGGIVDSIDVAAKKITIKQNRGKKERTLNLTVAKKLDKDLAGIKKGDAVNVMVTGKTVTGLTKAF